MNAEVKPGYKLTEVGVIPEDWEVMTLGTVSEMSSGTTPSRTLMDRYYKNGSIAWVKTLDLNNSDICETDECVTDLALKETCLRVNPIGTVLVAMYGGFNQIGRTGLLRLPAAVNQAITAIHPFKGVLLSDYLIRNINYRIEYWKRVASSSRKDPNITSKDIRDFPVAYPKLQEQEAIAEALSDADALIESLEQLIAKKRQIKQGSMQELLTGKKRLPGFSGEWEVKKLGDVVKISKGQLITEKNAISGDIPVIAGGKKPAYFHNKPNRIGKTITVSASGASAGYVAIFDEPIFASDCSTISEGEGYSIDFIYSQLQLKQEIIYQAQTGGAQPHIHAVDLMPIEIGVPSFSEQQAIAIILFDMDAEIGALGVKIENARQLKQGMMHKLLTGKIRLV